MSVSERVRASGRTQALVSCGEIDHRRAETAYAPRQANQKSVEDSTSAVHTEHTDTHL